MSQLVQQIPFATQLSEGRAPQATHEALDNMYVSVLPANARAPFVVSHTPGLNVFVEVGSGPIRCLQRFKDFLLVVSGDELYRVESNGSSTLIGTISGSPGRVFSAAGADHAILAATFDCYYTNGVTRNSLSITSMRNMAYQDGFGIATKATTEQFYVSNVDDLTTWDSLDFSSADAFSDHLVGLISDHRELWLFGQRSTEIWQNVGAANFPFVRSGAGFIERGCAARGSIAKANNSVFWLGNDLRVYMATGYQPQPISTPAVEYQIRQQTSPQTAEGFTYTQEGHVFYVLTFAGLTVVYDAMTNKWHKRSSFGHGRWRASQHASVFNKELVGDYINGKVYELDLDYYQEDTDTIYRTIDSAPMFSEGYRIVMDELYIDAESGVGASGQGDPLFILDWSDNGGVTWEGGFSRTPGAQGEYGKQMRWYGLGSFKQRTLRLKTYDPVPVRIFQALARMERLSQ